MQITWQLGTHEIVGRENDNGDLEIFFTWHESIVIPKAEVTWLRIRTWEGDGNWPEDYIKCERMFINAFHALGHRAKLLGP
jgi:hypothetical protein